MGRSAAWASCCVVPAARTGGDDLRGAAWVAAAANGSETGVATATSEAADGVVMSGLPGVITRAVAC